MKAYFLQHVPFEGPGYIHTWCNENETSLDRSALFKGEALPGNDDFDILFVMGGPMGVHDIKGCPWLTDEKKFIERSIAGGKKIIGICLGAQLIADVLGAPVSRNNENEIGWFQLEKTSFTGGRIDTLFPESFYAFHWHGDTFGIPSGARRLAKSEACENQAFIYDERVLALQFHLEATEDSLKDMLLNCADELIPGRYIQRPEEILDTTKIPSSNMLMGTLIETIGKTGNPS